MSAAQQHLPHPPTPGRRTPGPLLRSILAVAAALTLAVAAWPVLERLRDAGLVVGEPLLLAALLPPLALLPSTPVQRALGGGRTDRWPLLRILLGFSLVAAFAWTAGWSFMLPVAAVPISVFHVQRSGSPVWRTAALVSTAFTLAGQLAVELGPVPSVPERPVSHLAAAAALLLTAILTANVGLSVARRERSEHALARAEARLRALMDSSDDVITVSDAAGGLSYVSPAVRRAMGHHPEDLLGTPLLGLVDHEQREAVTRCLEQVVASGPGARSSLDVLVVHASRERRWYEWTVLNLLDDPLVEGLVVNQRDVTERLLHSAALAHAAAHDDLTGLPNRGELLRRLATVLPEASHGAGVAVLFIDLDRFKEVNDTLGHAAGDDLLVVLARRLHASLRRQDHFARLGGDEFGAILTEVRDPAEVQAVISRLEHDLSQPVSLAGRHIAVGASIGAAITVDPRTGAAALFADADAAMYRIKNARRRTEPPPADPALAPRFGSRREDW